MNQQMGKIDDITSESSFGQENRKNSNWRYATRFKDGKLFEGSRFVLRN